MKPYDVTGLRERIAATEQFVQLIQQWDIRDQYTALSFIVDALARPGFDHLQIIDNLKQICDGVGLASREMAVN